MIVPQNPPKSPLGESSKSSTGESTTVTDDSPPAYEPPSSIAPPHIKPSNYISLTRPFDNIKGTFVLDPNLRLPQPMLSNDKVNLTLSALMGEVSAIVYVVGSKSLPGDKTRMEVSSTMGSTRLEIHAAEQRAPISISITARLGEVKLLLPRSFRGPLRLSATLGQITLSPALRAGTVTTGDRMFVGDWTEEELKQEAWVGDEASVDSALGSVSVAYNDEKKKGFLESLGFTFTSV